MKQLIGSLVAATAVAYLWVPARAIAQPVAACEVAGEYYPVGEAYVNEPEPAYIHGSEVGSTVNVRSGPGLNFDVAATSEVGYYAEVVGQAFSDDCETWIQVRFPISKIEGWVHSRYVMLIYGRGWWI
jgi:uncharacterized protein YgiM (DUF1202 family)